MSATSRGSLAPLLIVAAMPNEVRALLTDEAPAAPEARLGWPIITINRSVSVALSGIGRANAAGATAQALSLRRYAAVINVGVAGALHDSGLSVGDVVLATESIFAEEGIDLPEGPGDVAALGFPLGEPAWCEGNRVRPDAALLDRLGESIGQGVERGGIATVARCSGTDHAARQVARQTGARAEAMEGAAVLLAAHRMGVHQCGEVRIISNTCGDRLRQHWDLSAALNRLDLVLERLVELAG